MNAFIASSCCQQINRKNVVYWQTKWAQSDCYKKSNCYDMMNQFKEVYQWFSFLPHSTSLHYLRRVTNYLNIKRPNLWNGRNGPVAWSTYSPHLTPSDHSLRGHFKSKTYSPTIACWKKLNNKKRTEVWCKDWESLSNTKYYRTLRHIFMRKTVITSKAYYVHKRSACYSFMWFVYLTRNLKSV